MYGQQLESEESLPLLGAAAAEARRVEAADGGASPSSRPSSPGPDGELSASAVDPSDAAVAAAEAAARQAYRKQLLGLGLYALSTVFGTGMSLCAKLAGRGGVGVFAVVLYRSLTLLAFTTPELLWERLNPFEDPRRRWMYVLRGALGFASTSSLYLAVTLLPMADAAVLAFLSPVWVALLSPLVLKEHPSKAVFLAIPCCMVGVVLTARPSFVFGGAGGMSLVGVAVGIMQAFFNAAARMSVRAIHSLGGKESMAAIIFSMGLVSALLSMVAMAVMPGTQLVLPHDTATWLAVAGNGLFGYGNQVTLTAALQRATAAPAVAMGYLSVVWGLVADVLIFKDYPTALSLVGAGIVCASSFFVAYGEKKARDKEKAAIKFKASQARLSAYGSAMELTSSPGPSRAASPTGPGSSVAAPLLPPPRPASP